MPKEISSLFSNEKYKKYALSLYNALNGVDYQDESELEIVTIRDFIYIRMHNDVAVMLSGNLELWEHQSTVNPNMPIRGLLYFAQLYEKYIATRRYSLYRNMRIMLPTPTCAPIRFVPVHRFVQCIRPPLYPLPLIPPCFSLVPVCLRQGQYIPVILCIFRAIFYSSISCSTTEMPNDPPSKNCVYPKLSAMKINRESSNRSHPGNPPRLVHCTTTEHTFYISRCRIKNRKDDPYTVN